MNRNLIDAIRRQVERAGPAGGAMGLRKVVAKVLRRIRERGIIVLWDEEDVLQEVHVRIVRHGDRYDPRWSLSTWAGVIARNLVLQHARGRDPLRVARGFPAVRDEEADGTEVPCDPDPGPEPSARAAEIRRAWAELEERLGYLGRRLDLSILRTVVRCDGCRASAAREVGTTVGAVKAAMRRVKSFGPCKRLAKLHAEIVGHPIS